MPFYFKFETGETTCQMLKLCWEPQWRVLVVLFIFYFLIFSFLIFFAPSGHMFTFIVQLCSLISAALVNKISAFYSIAQYCGSLYINANVFWVLSSKHICSHDWTLCYKVEKVISSYSNSSYTTCDSNMLFRLFTYYYRRRQHNILYTDYRH